MPFFLCIGVLTYFFSVYMFIPIFYYYITDIGGGHIEFGVIISTSALITSLLQSYIGYLSDRKGVLKIVALGCFLSAISLLSVAIVSSAWLLIVLYVCLQFGIGAIAPALYGVVSRIKLKDDKNFIPYYRSIQGIGVILGPFIGGVISDVSLKANVIIASFLIVIAFICFYHYFKKLPQIDHLNPEETERKEKDEKSSFFFALRKVLMNKVFLSICLLFLFIELAYDCITFNVPMIGERMQTETTLIGMATSAYFLTFTLFQVPINNILRKIKVKVALITMGMLSLLTSTLFLVNSSFYVIIFAMGLSGITIGSLFTYCAVISSELAPNSEKGLYLGVFNTIMPLTDVASPLFTALLFGYAIRLPFYLSFSLICGFILIAVLQKSEKLPIS